MRYDWTVTVGGVNVSQWVRAGGQIDYGRRTAATSFQAPTAVFEMFTKDAHPAPAPNPWPTIRLGDPVVIHVTWDGATQHRRFTGHVQALDWGLYGLRVTAAGTTVDWNNRWAGSNTNPWTIPDELETDRVRRLAAQAGVTVTTEGVPARRLRAIPTGTTGQRVLDCVLRVADDCDALLLEDRLGAVRYRTRNYARPSRWVIPAHLVEADTLELTLERGSLVNQVTVYYGEPDPVTGLQLGASQQDDPSIQQWGEHRAEFYTDIQYRAGAEGKGAKYLERNRIQWTVPDLTLVMNQATGAEADAVLAIQENWRVTVQPLPAGCPIASFDGDVLGITELMHETDFRVMLHLGPPVGDEDEPPEEPLFPADAITGGTTGTYEDQYGFLWQYHAWKAAGDYTFTVNEPVTPEVLVVAGGGAGGYRATQIGGGGGGGGVWVGELSFTPGTVAVHVGAGGYNPATEYPGRDGGNTTLAGLTVIGGGGGGYGTLSANKGRDGGSGGGPWGQAVAGSGANPDGFHGGSAGSNPDAGGASGTGRAGYLSSITGVAVEYGAGGTGGLPGERPPNAGVHGTGGGGEGGMSGGAGSGGDGGVYLRYRIG